LVEDSLFFLLVGVLIFLVHILCSNLFILPFSFFSCAPLPIEMFRS
jgi:hypothetical protein